MCSTRVKLGHKISEECSRAASGGIAAGVSLSSKSPLNPVRHGMVRVLYEGW